MVGGLLVSVLAHGVILSYSFSNDDVFGLPHFSGSYQDRSTIILCCF